MPLYKFMTSEAAMKTLENCSLLISNPLYFNDPFDCCLAVDENEEQFLLDARLARLGGMAIGCSVYKPSRDFNDYNKLLQQAIDGKDIQYGYPSFFC
ncbi:MAG: hypothetical protein J6J35_06605 [Alphaproteobacteria bacterium]|nr:hypothetical protein [Alphaproteobacteria bacterium]